MLKQHSSFVKQLIAVVDCLLIFAAFYISYAAVSQVRVLFHVIQYWLMIVGFLAFYLYFAWTRSLFSILEFNWMKGFITRIVMIFISAGVLGAAILYMFLSDYNSRILYFSFAALSFVFITIEKLLLKNIIETIRRLNKNTTPILIFGRGRGVSQTISEIENHPQWGLRVIQTLDITTPIGQFEEILKKSYVEEIFFCIPRQFTRNNFNIDQYLQICEVMGRPARVFININEATRFARWEYHRFMNRQTLISHTVELDPDQVLFKRIFDIVGSIVGLGILACVYPILAIGIKATSKGPVFFKQVRVGKNGKRFIIYKFRSMCNDAEAKKKELMRHNELSGAVFKMKNDPRITGIGAFMRKFSLDELPQFINVFRGEMSLVGTRPPTPDEVTQYAKWHHRRMSIRPGITGMWQVSGRNKITDFNDIVRFDLQYIDSWSIGLDIHIILKTILIVFERDKAF